MFSVPKSCFLMQQALLVQMDERDELKVNKRRGEISQIKMCISNL